MTYARPAHGFATETTRLKAALGEARLARALGCGASWLQRCANPATPQALSLEQAVAADTQAARAGLGTPLWDEYARRLAAAGALDPFGADAGRMPFAGAVRAAAAALRQALEQLEAALAGGPGLRAGAREGAA